MTIPNDLAKLLSDALEQRCQRNPKYSLRAFARDLGVPAPRLSRWLKGEDGLSRESATHLAGKLGMSKNEREVFVIAMEAKYGRAKKLRSQAQTKLAALTAPQSSLDVEAFKLIADWYNLATLSLVETRGFRDDPAWIAARLGISIHEARGARGRLLQLEMLEARDGKLVPTGVFFANPAGVSSQSVRSFHRQILEKAKTALEFQTPEERDFSALVLAVDAAKLDEARSCLREFRTQFEARFCSSATEKNEVYALGLQFFRLTENLPPHFQEKSV